MKLARRRSDAKKPQDTHRLSAGAALIHVMEGRHPVPIDAPAFQEPSAEVLTKVPGGVMSSPSTDGIKKMFNRNKEQSEWVPAITDLPRTQREQRR